METVDRLEDELTKRRMLASTASIDVVAAEHRRVADIHADAICEIRRLTRNLDAANERVRSIERRREGNND